MWRRLPPHPRRPRWAGGWVEMRAASSNRRRPAVVSPSASASSHDLGAMSSGELVILLVICLLVFGAHRLPEAGRVVGKGLRDFQRAVNAARDAVDNAPDRAPSSPPRSPPPPRRLLE